MDSIAYLGGKENRVFGVGGRKCEGVDVYVGKLYMCLVYVVAYE